MTNRNFLKFDSEAEAAAAADAIRDPAKGLHARVWADPLFVELVFNAPEPVELETLCNYDAALETFRTHVEMIQPASEYRSRAYIENPEHRARDAEAGFPLKTFDPERWTDDGRARIRIDAGRKYDKVVSLGSQTSVHCFVRKADGAVLKAASWKAPAKHARGTIYTNNPDDYGVAWTGAHYL